MGDEHDVIGDGKTPKEYKQSVIFYYKDSPLLI